MADRDPALQAALGESYYQMNQLQSEMGTKRRPTATGGRPVFGRGRQRRNTGRRSEFRSAAPATGRRCPSGTLPTERSRPLTAPGAFVRSSGGSGGIAPTPGGLSGPTVTGDTATAPQPMAAGLPPVPPLPQLSPLPPVPSLPQLPPLVPVAGQPAATPHRRRSKKAARLRGDETDELAGDDKDPTKATSGAAESERTPVALTPTRWIRRSPLGWVRITAGPSAGTPPQDGR